MTVQSKNKLLGPIPIKSIVWNFFHTIFSQLRPSQQKFFILILSLLFFIRNSQVAFHS